MKTGMVTVDLWVALHGSQIFTTLENMIGGVLLSIVHVHKCV